MTDFVNVRIAGRKTVQYDQVVKVQRADYEKYMKMLESKNRDDVKKAEEIIGEVWIDPTDILDSDEIEIDEIELVDDGY